MKTKRLLMTLLAFSTVYVWADEMIVTPHSNVGGDIKVTASLGLDYTIFANAADGYEFLYWSDGVTTNPRTMTLTTSQDVTMRAVFGKTSDLHVTNGEVRAILVDPIVPSYQLQAIPTSACGAFVQWNNGSGVNPVAYQESDGTRIPTFSSSRPDVVDATPHNGVGGMVTVEPVAETCADYLCTATANTADGYEFLYWADGETNATRTYTYNGGDTQLRAVFAKTADIHSTGGDVDVMVLNPTTPSYSMTATAGSCTSFLKWSNDATGNTITYLESDGTVKPIFDQKEMLYQKTDHEGGTIKAIPRACGYTLTPVPAAGFMFAYWEDGSVIAERDIDFAEHAYTATFVKDALAQRGTDVYATVQGAVDANSEAPVVVLVDNDENIIVNAPVTIQGSGHTIGDMTIQMSGDVTLANELEVNNLYLNATTGQSSQLRNETNLSYNKAYVDIQLEAGETKASPDKWYAVAVPFPVNILTGVRRQSRPEEALTNMSDYLFWSYNGQMRADNCENGWEQMVSGVLESGRFYMLGIDGDENTWRFEKTEGSNLSGNADVALAAYPSSSVGDQNWNAVGNTQLYYANAQGGAYAYIYDNKHSAYTAYPLEDYTYVMASPFFIQGTGSLSLVAGDKGEGKRFAPTRMGEHYSFTVRITNEETSDYLYLSADERATNSYEEGKDLLKMKSNTVPQLWTDGYGYSLAAKNVSLDEANIIFPLELFAPKAGTYTLDCSTNSDEQVYLMENGVIIWNLSLVPYTIDLYKGVSKDYAVLLRTPVRTLPTSNPAIETKDGVQKVILDDHLYIITDYHTYNASGAKLK